MLDRDWVFEGDSWMTGMDPVGHTVPKRKLPPSLPSMPEKWKVEVLVTQCLTLWDSLDCNLPHSSVHRTQTWVSHTAGKLFTVWATRVAPKPDNLAQILELLHHLWMTLDKMLLLLSWVSPSFIKWRLILPLLRMRSCICMLSWHIISRYFSRDTDCILVKESATLVLRQVSDAEGLIEEEVCVSFLALTSGISVLNEASSGIPHLSSDLAEMILK